MALEENGSQECLLTRAEWLYILVEERENLGPKQWGKLEAQAMFWAVGSNSLFDLNG